MRTVLDLMETKREMEEMQKDRWRRRTRSHEQRDSRSMLGWRGIDRLVRALRGVVVLARGGDGRDGGLLLRMSS